MSERNQCDGCQAGMELSGDIHRDANGRAVMVCQRDKYTAGEAMEAAIEQHKQALEQAVALLGAGWRLILREALDSDPSRNVLGLALWDRIDAFLAQQEKP